MAAMDVFERSLGELSQPTRQTLSSLIARTREDLLAARSEDARERIVRDFVRNAHDLAEQPRR